jgi:hypothetical protein
VGELTGAPIELLCFPICVALAMMRKLTLVCRNEWLHFNVVVRFVQARQWGCSGLPHQMTAVLFVAAGADMVSKCQAMLSWLLTHPSFINILKFLNRHLKKKEKDRYNI